jgi:hypothetical protein
MIDIKIKRIAGVDDLEGMGGDQATEWWTKEDWDKWDADKPARDARNAARIEKLRASGKYGKEYDLTFHFKESTIFGDLPAGAPYKNMGIFIPGREKVSLWRRMMRWLFPIKGLRPFKKVGQRGKYTIFEP